MFQLLGMFTKALGMFYPGSAGQPYVSGARIITQSGQPLITEASAYIVTD